MSDPQDYPHWREIARWTAEARHARENTPETPTPDTTDHTPRSTSMPSKAYANTTVELGHIKPEYRAEKIGEAIGKVATELLRRTEPGEIADLQGRGINVHFTVDSYTGTRLIIAGFEGEQL